MKETGESESPRTSADAEESDLLWLRDGGERKQRRAAPLTLERIIDAAVTELDTHGSERLTMRRLAQRLEVTSTALYWHVSSKDDLLDIALDHVIGEVRIPEPGLEPRAALRELLLGWRAAMLAHPWSPSLLGRPLLGPNVLARTEYLQAMLVHAGLSRKELATATSLLIDFVIGAATNGATWRRLDNPAVLAKARAHITGLKELYPTLSTYGFVEGRWSQDELFHLGLDRVLATLMR